MVVVDDADALRRSDEAHEDDVLGALLLEQRERGRRAAARGEHRVDDDERALGDVARQLAVVLDRLQRLRVAVHADVADAGRRDHVDDAVEHAEAGAQDRHDADFLAGEHLLLALANRRLDLDFLEREVARDLISHEHRDFLEQLAEVLRARLLHAHDRELMLDQRMVDDVDVHWFSHVRYPFLHNTEPLLKTYKKPYSIDEKLTFMFRSSFIAFVFALPKDKLLTFDIMLRRL